jgi:hypothetical protein
MNTSRDCNNSPEFLFRYQGSNDASNFDSSGISSEGNHHYYSFDLNNQSPLMQKLTFHFPEGTNENDLGIRLHFHLNVMIFG